MGKREPLCADCQNIELRMASVCREREQAAKARGEEYECRCPGVTCHWMHHEKPAQRQGKGEGS